MKIIPLKVWQNPFSWSVKLDSTFGVSPGAEKILNDTLQGNVLELGQARRGRFQNVGVYQQGQGL